MGVNHFFCENYCLENRMISEFHFAQLPTSQAKNRALRTFNFLINIFDLKIVKIDLCV